MKLLHQRLLPTIKILVPACLAAMSPVTVFAQASVASTYAKADSLLSANKLPEAYKLYKILKPTVQENDTLYNYVVLRYTALATEFEKEARSKEKFSAALPYGLEALQLIQENKSRFNEKFATKEPWMIKNIIVSYFGLGQLGEAGKYRTLLYQNYQNKTLPNGIDTYFNFDFFKIGDKNVWGYEWYAELPENRFSSSFTKIVYYVYSTNPDGSDKDQLYRFHVLMFHQEAKDAKFDYLLEKQQDTSEGTISGSYYKYTYSKNIDYKKLKENVQEVIKDDLLANTKRIIPKQK